MEEISLRPGAFRPGGGANADPYSEFKKGAGVQVSAAQKSASQSANAHKALIKETKERQGVTVLKYTREVLESFAAANTRTPSDLGTVKGLLVDDVNAGNTATDGTGEASWRPKGAAAAALISGSGVRGANREFTPKRRDVAPPGALESGGTGGPPARPVPGGGVTSIETAADRGRTKWAPAKNISDVTKARNTVRGILNKLTPDNFDRLSVKVLEVVAVSSEILRDCIPLIFEKAVAEPTFCELYAELCQFLTRELEPHDFGTEDGKPVTFKRELLNTCQDEFEGMEAQRDKLDASRPDYEEQSHKLKVRQLGTVRLLAELFNKDLVTQPIMRIVVGELMSRGCVDGNYDGPLIECIVQALTLCGAKMSASDKLRKSVNTWLASLKRWSTDPALESRIRFKIEDLTDQVQDGWQARREAYTVKKTQDIRKQAHAELRMATPLNDVGVLDFLPKLHLAHIGRAGAVPTVDAAMAELFPPTRDDPDDAATDTTAGGASAAPVAPVQRGALSDEDVRKKAAAAFQEFLSIRDYKEAVTCIRELGATEAQDALIVQGALENMYDVQKDSEVDLLCKLVLHFSESDCLSASGLRAGVQSQTDALEDLSMDVPKSPQIIGKLLAAVIGAGALPLATLEPLLAKVEGADPKRRLVKELLSGLAAELGEEAAAQMVSESGVYLGPLLDADAEFEPADKR